TNASATNLTPVTASQLVTALTNPGTQLPGTQQFLQGQGIQPLAVTTAPALLAQGQLQQPGNVNQYQPDVLLARLGFVGLLQADPNARFSLPRLLTGGGGEQT